MLYDICYAIKQLVFAYSVVCGLEFVFTYCTLCILFAESLPSAQVQRKNLRLHELDLSLSSLVKNLKETKKIRMNIVTLEP